MSDFVECDYCGSELRFVECEPSSKHDFRAECTQCFTKSGVNKGRARFNAWVSNKQIDVIAEQYPATKIVPFKK